MFNCVGGVLVRCNYGYINNVFDYNKIINPIQVLKQKFLVTYVYYEKHSCEKTRETYNFSYINVK